MSKFKIGDRVRVAKVTSIDRRNLSEYNLDDTPYRLNEEFTIDSVRHYITSEDSYADTKQRYISESFLELVNDESINTTDNVNSPQHYTTGGIETIDYLKAKLTPEEYKGFLKGSIIKYVSRSMYKNAESEDYQKAQWYIDKLNKI